MLQYLFLLLPVAAGCGWAMGYRSKLNNRRLLKKLPSDYFLGINYLINEEPDKAVDVFIKLLEVDSDTVETHLALGSLFRRRGEVDRAIRIHQSLVARPELSRVHKVEALSALAEDYFRAGVLDRAEKIFLELVELGEVDSVTYKNLLSIYQQEKEWQKAIDMAEKIAKKTKDSMTYLIAQYYCELSEDRLSLGQSSDAENMLKKALSIDSSCVRAYILRAKLHIALQEYKQAIRCYKRIRELDIDFITEVLDPLARCYHVLQDEKGLIDFLYSCVNQSPRLPLVIRLADYLQRHQDATIANEFVTKQLKRLPGVKNLNQLASLYVLQSHDSAQQKFELLNDLMHRMKLDNQSYQCGYCGFASRTHYWLCPGCHTWDTIKPRVLIENEAAAA